MKTIEQAKKEGNDNGNQSIKSKFVEREIFSNVNSMVDYILQKSYEDSDAPFNWEDIDNYYSYPEWSENVLGEDLYFEGGSEEDKEAFLQKFDDMEQESQDLLDAEEISEETHERNVSTIQDAKDSFEEIETEPAEVYEWYIVSGYLLNKLKEKGQCVIDHENLWGRQTTGQAILLDYVITEICAEMEILEGQANDWSK